MKIKSSFTFIQRYGSVRIEIVKSDGILKTIRFYNIVFYKKFKVNVISFFRLKKKKIYWNTIDNILFQLKDKKMLAIIIIVNKQYIFELSSRKTTVLSILFVLFLKLYPNCELVFTLNWTIKIKPQRSAKPQSLILKTIAL